MVDTKNATCIGQYSIQSGHVASNFGSCHRTFAHGGYQNCYLYRSI